MEKNINREDLYLQSYDLVKYYVRFYSRQSYYRSLFQIITLEDAIQEVMLKFARFQHLEKYDSLKSSFKYHIYFSVRRILAELMRMRKYRYQHFSLEQITINEEGDNINSHLLEDGKSKYHYEDKSLSVDMRRLMQGLPTTPIKVNRRRKNRDKTFQTSPNITYNNIVEFLLKGWTIKSIEEYYGCPLSRHIKIIRKYFNDFREELKLNAV